MKTPARLGLYGLTLAAIFGGAFAVGNVVVPDSASAEWTAAAENVHEGMPGMGGESDAAGSPADAPARGVSLVSGGFQLSEVTAPDTVGASSDFSFSILDSDGNAVTEYTESHEKELHLIAVRTDGAEFRHVHPELQKDGTWSMPWTWDEPGTYRVFTDFVPEDEEAPVTLTRTVDVAGEFAPATPQDEVREAQVGEYEVQLDGDLLVGASSTLTLSVTKDGESVTTIEPYLGAFGHLVALRDGDLAYLHVHPEGAEPEAGQVSGPDVEFATEAPTTGRYLLYFDFQIDGEVHSAPFVLETADSESAGGESHGDDDDTH